MIKVSEILRVKGHTLFTATPDMSVIEAVKVMSEHDIGSLIVMEYGELVGILTFREVIKFLDKAQGNVGETRVGTIMDDAPMTISPNTEVNEVRRLMLEKHARYIPVMDGRTLTGVISFYDLARAMLDAKDFENQMLKAFIRDWPDESAPEKN